jgi:hypothetical protein
VLYAYFVLLDSYAGTTVGKRILGLRVIGPSGERPSIKQAAIREACESPHRSMTAHLAANEDVRAAAVRAKLLA